MSRPNQFSAELIWMRIDSYAIHGRTGAVCRVRYVHDDDKWEWTITHHGERTAGRSKSEVGARAACKRRIAKLPDR